MMLCILIVKYLAKRTVSDKILTDAAYEIAINPKYDGYQRGLARIVYKSFDNKTIRSKCK